MALAMTHPNVAGISYSVSQTQFDAVWAPRGWVLSSTPTVAPHQLVVVEHGSDANVERPDVDGPVVWVGTVEPVNAVPTDLWI